MERRDVERCCCIHTLWNLNIYPHFWNARSPRVHVARANFTRIQHPRLRARRSRTTGVLAPTPSVRCATSAYASCASDWSDTPYMRVVSRTPHTQQKSAPGSIAICSHTVGAHGSRSVVPSPHCDSNAGNGHLTGKGKPPPRARRRVSLGGDTAICACAADVICRGFQLACGRVRECTEAQDGCMGEEEGGQQDLSCACAKPKSSGSRAHPFQERRSSKFSRRSRPGTVRIGRCALASGCRVAGFDSTALPRDEIGDYSCT